MVDLLDELQEHVESIDMANGKLVCSSYFGTLVSSDLSIGLLTVV